MAKKERKKTLYLFLTEKEYREIEEKGTRQVPRPLSHASKMCRWLCVDENCEECARKGGINSYRMFTVNDFEEVLLSINNSDYKESMRFEFGWVVGNQDSFIVKLGKRIEKI